MIEYIRFILLMAIVIGLSIIGYQLNDTKHETRLNREVICSMYVTFIPAGTIPKELSC